MTQACSTPRAMQRIDQGGGMAGVAIGHVREATRRPSHEPGSRARDRETGPGSENGKRNGKLDRRPDPQQHPHNEMQQFAVHLERPDQIGPDSNVATARTEDMPEGAPHERAASTAGSGRRRRTRRSTRRRRITGSRRRSGCGAGREAYARVCFPRSPIGVDVAHIVGHQGCGHQEPDRDRQQPRLPGLRGRRERTGCRQPRRGRRERTQRLRRVRGTRTAKGRPCRRGGPRSLRRRPRGSPSSNPGEVQAAGGGHGEHDRRALQAWWG